MRRPLVLLLTAACIGGGAPALAQVFPRSPDSQDRIETRVNTLEGKPLRYLIGTDGTASGRDDEVTVVSYSRTQPAKRGISVAYCNLFDELNTGRYGPYLHASDTAAQYNEGQIDPRGPGGGRTCASSSSGVGSRASSTSSSTTPTPIRSRTRSARSTWRLATTSR